MEAGGRGFDRTNSHIARLSALRDFCYSTGRPRVRIMRLRHDAHPRYRYKLHHCKHVSDMTRTGFVLFF